MYLPEIEARENARWPGDQDALLTEARSMIGIVVHLSQVTIQGAKSAKSFLLKVADTGSGEGGYTVSLIYSESHSLLRLMKHWACFKPRPASE